MLLHPVEPAPAVVVATPTAAPQLTRWPGYPPAYRTAHTQEGPMNTGWPVHRTGRAQNDGERRWDSASQCLLQWAMEHPAGTSPAPSHPPEESHGSHALRPCLAASSATAADACTPPASPPRRRCDATRLACRRRAYLSRRRRERDEGVAKVLICYPV